MRGVYLDDIERQNVLDTPEALITFSSLCHVHHGGLTWKRMLTINLKCHAPIQLRPSVSQGVQIIGRFIGHKESKHS